MLGRAHQETLILYIGLRSKNLLGIGNIYLTQNDTHLPNIIAQIICMNWNEIS